MLALAGRRGRYRAIVAVEIIVVVVLFYSVVHHRGHTSTGWDVNNGMVLTSRLAWVLGLGNNKFIRNKNKARHPGWDGMARFTDTHPHLLSVGGSIATLIELPSCSCSCPVLSPSVPVNGRLPAAKIERIDWLPGPGQALPLQHHLQKEGVTKPSIPT